MRDGDRITIDAEANTIEWHVDADEASARRAAWEEPPLATEGGVLLKYVRSVSSASRGCVTDA